MKKRYIAIKFYGWHENNTETATMWEIVSFKEDEDITIDAIKEQLEHSFSKFRREKNKEIIIEDVRPI